MNDSWNDALLATAKRMDVKDIEKAQKEERKRLRAVAKEHRDRLKVVMKSITVQLAWDIAITNKQIVDEFAQRRKTQAEGKVLAIAIGEHDKGGAQ